MSDEVLMWVHRKYEMSQIVQKNIHLKQTTSLILLLPKMIDSVDEVIKLVTCKAQE